MFVQIFWGKQGKLNKSHYLQPQYNIWDRHLNDVWVRWVMSFKILSHLLVNEGRIKSHVTFSHMLGNQGRIKSQVTMNLESVYIQKGSRELGSEGYLVTILLISP